MRALVLGCGPAGLMAAHAAALNDWDVYIFSKKRKSYMRGAQYLHAPIPAATQTEPFKVTYELRGDVEGYRQKVYGDRRVRVSPEELLGDHEGWDIRQTYDWLWDTYGSYVQDFDVLDDDMLRRTIDVGQPDLVISTVPAQIMCYNDESHFFTYETVWATEVANSIGNLDNHVLCSGEYDVPWYRQSRIHGWENTEYPQSKRPPLSAEKVHAVQKPVATNCDCWPNITRMGRYGQWTKGVLSHTTFFEVAKLTASQQGSLW